MLNKEELYGLFDHLGLPPKGRELVLRARVEAPVRAVKSQGGNVITLLASRKMGREIRTESRHIEFAAAVDKEYDSNVIEYYAQPCLLRLELIGNAFNGLNVMGQRLRFHWIEVASVHASNLQHTPLTVFGRTGLALRTDSLVN